MLAVGGKKNGHIKMHQSYLLTTDFLRLRIQNTTTETTSINKTPPDADTEAIIMIPFEYASTLSVVSVTK